MISSLTGKIAQIKPDWVLIITAGGVGYGVRVPIGSIANSDEVITLKTTLIVREQELTLYGFETDDQQTLFNTLLGVNGIGPRSAMAFLSFPVQQTLQAIENEDATALARTPGVGKKTAQKIILELKGKLKLDGNEKPRNAGKTEAAQALESLGFNPKLIAEALDSFESDDSETLIRQFLASYGK